MWAVFLLPGLAAAFCPPSFPSITTLSRTGALHPTERGSCSGSRALVVGPLQSSFYGGEWDPFARSSFRVRPGTWVRVKDLGVPGVVLSSQDDGSYLLQVAGSSTPLLIRRRLEDLQLESPSAPSRATATRPQPLQQQQHRAGSPSFSQQRQNRQSQETEDESQQQQQQQGTYRLYRDPRTGRVYAAYERPKLPPQASTGRRVKMAPPREQLSQPGYGKPSRPQQKMPGYDFMEKTFEDYLRQPSGARNGAPAAGGRGDGAGDLFDVLKQLARGHMLNDEYAKAQQQLRDAYSRDGSRFDDNMLADLAETEHRQGRLTEASKYYQQALQQNEKNSRAVLQYGVSLHDQGQTVQAMQLYQKAIDLNDQNAQAYNNLGVAFQELGQPESALACYRKALEIDGLNEAALQNIAALTVNQGRLRLAAECVRRALLLDPNNKTAQRLATKVVQRISAGRTYPLLPGRFMDSGAGDDEEESEEDDEELLSGARAVAQQYDPYIGSRRSQTETKNDRQQQQQQQTRPQQQQPQQRDEEDEEDSESYGDAVNRYMNWQDVLEEAWRRKEELKEKEAAEQEARRMEEQHQRQAELQEAERRRQAVEDSIRGLNMQRQQQTPPREPIAKTMPPKQQQQQQQPQPQPQQSELGDDDLFGLYRAAAQQRIGSAGSSKQAAKDEKTGELRQQGSAAAAPSSERPKAQAPRQAETSRGAPGEAVSPDLQRERLRAAAEAWQNLQKAAWAQAAEREKITGQARQKMEQERELARAQTEARERQTVEQERAERQARERQAMLELEEAKAREAARMAAVVQEKTKQEAERLRAQVEEDRRQAVKQAWEEQLRSQLVEQEEVKQELARKRMEAVRQAVESERYMLEKQRQEAELQERIAKEKDYASYLMDEREAIGRQQSWAQWRQQERARQAQAWAERESILQERRRRVEEGLGIHPGTQPSAVAIEDEDDGPAWDQRDQQQPEEERQLPQAYPIERASAQVPFFITKDMRRQLVEDMNYSLSEVNSMRPEIALQILREQRSKPRRQHRDFTNVISTSAEPAVDTC